MSDSYQISILESFHNSYHVFIFILVTLSKQPEEQCEIMGNYNTDWELKHDALAGYYLIESELFIDQQKSATLNFLTTINSIPVNDMPGGFGRDANFLAMQHSAWESIRLLSKDLLIILAPLTETNQKFFDSQSIKLLL